MDDIISRLSEIEELVASYIDMILKKKEIAAEGGRQKSFGSKILMPNEVSIAALRNLLGYLQKKGRYWNLSSNLKKPLGIYPRHMTLTMINMWIHYFQK